MFAAVAWVAGLMGLFSLVNSGAAANFFGGQVRPPSYQLSFYNLHTHENLNVVYRDGTYYSPTALVKVNEFMRDYRSGGVRQIDAHLLDVLYGLKTTLQQRHPGMDVHFEVISGYRSYGTNTLLREAGGAQAKHSQHIAGKAIDIRVPGIDLVELRNTAWCLEAGGVGYYQFDDFVHVDTGKRRFWNWNPRADRVRCRDSYIVNE